MLCVQRIDETGIPCMRISGVRPATIIAVPLQIVNDIHDNLMQTTKFLHQSVTTRPGGALCRRAGTHARRQSPAFQLRLRRATIELGKGAVIPMPGAVQ